MTTQVVVSSRIALFGGLLMTFITSADLSAQRGESAGGGRGAAWDVTQARGKTREIDFTTSEGTRTSVDLSPDGTWVVFDLLGHVYRVPVAGGTATVLTQNSGVALNFQPRISPDGKTIAFITDRRGQYNLWVMDADGGNPRAVFTDGSITALEPAWMPDGKYIVVRRGGRGGGEGGAGSGGLWMYSKDGGAGVQLVATEAGAGGRGGSAPSWPTVSRDGKYLYYQVNETVADEEPISGGQQIKRFEFKTGETSTSALASAAAPPRGARPVVARQRPRFHRMAAGWLLPVTFPTAHSTSRATSLVRARRSGCAIWRLVPSGCSWIRSSR